MHPESRRQLDELYQAARSLPPAERTQLLDRADPQLRAEVEALLVQGSGTNLLETETIVISGKQLGPYHLQELIGAGGMGEVYRAMDSRLRRTIAIKLLPRHLAGDPALKRRFLREARAASALNHPNIAALYDISSHEGADFLVMEYVAGRTLKDLIPSEGMDFDQVA